MYLNPNKPAEGKIYYIQKGFRDKNGKATSKIIRKLGTLEEIRQREGVCDAFAWAREQARIETERDKENLRVVMIKKYPDKLLNKDETNNFNIGYLTLNKIYHEMGLDKICAGIERQHDFAFDLSEIMRQLVLCRILWPGSKLETWKMAATLALVTPVKLRSIYRALAVIGDSLEYIQQRLFHYSKDLLCRDTSVIYYDCTNFFFESVRETELRKPGASKENRRTPIVQMGVFMDADGLPLAFNINPGNTNEQTTLRPLEKMIGEKMDIERFIMCTDAGLASGSNRLYNDTDYRKFITVQSVKTLPDKDTNDKKHPGPIKTWALSPQGWKLPGDPETEYNIEDICKLTGEARKAYRDKIFFKERWYKTMVDDVESGQKVEMEQRLVVSFSLKYMDYQRQIRANNLDKAAKAIAHGNAGDPPKSFRKYIKTTKCTSEGEVADIDAGYELDLEMASEEEKYEGFYAVCTNLKEYTDRFGRVHNSVAELLRINRARWEIEYLFRILKTQFKTRPVYLRTDKAVKAHFCICFIALFIYRVLENRMGDEFTTDEILKSLRNMNASFEPSEGFIPNFTRTDLTDKLFEISGFRLDNQIIMLKKFKSIIAASKRRI